MKQRRAELERSYHQKKKKLNSTLYLTGFCLTEASKNEPPIIYKSPYKLGRSKRYPPFINHFRGGLPANMGQKGRVGRGAFYFIACRIGHSSLISSLAFSPYYQAHEDFKG